MEDKILKKIEKTINKIKDNKNKIEYYDVNTINDCYHRLTYYLDTIKKYGLKEVNITNIEDEIQITNNILKRS